MSQIPDTNAPTSPSTVLDYRAHEDPTANQPKDGLDAPAEKPGTARDAIAKAFDEQDKANGEVIEKKPDPGKEDPALKDGEEAKPSKVEKVEKPVEAKEPAEKPAIAEEPQAKAAREDAERRRREEGKPFYDPPAKFLPKAKELWSNVPNAVKAEIDRVSREHEAEVSQYRESHENWQKLAKYDQLAKQHNVTVSDALERYTAVDALLKNNPIEGIRQVLETIGITPKQYAEFVTQNPQAAQPQRQQPQPDPVAQQTSKEVQELRGELTSMRQQQAAREIIEPFAKANPRYFELQGDIAFFLESGKIPNTLSPSERLEAAYDMAERINPRSAPAYEPDETDAPEPKPAVDLRGTKSIRGGPSAGFDPATQGRVKNRRDAIKSAMAEFGA